MKKSILYLLSSAMLVSSASCVTDDEECQPTSNQHINKVKQKGEPQFKLYFLNNQNVDLDLYVKDPLENIISSKDQKSLTGGIVDLEYSGFAEVENIYWPMGDFAPKGTYHYWVKHNKISNHYSTNSDFILQVIHDGEIVAIEKGSLDYGTSSVFIYHHF